MPKPGTVKTLADFRGISLLDAIRKWYAAALLSIAKRWVKQTLKEQWNAFFIFGFEENRRTEDIYVSLQMVLQNPKALRVDGNFNYVSAG